MITDPTPLVGAVLDDRYRVIALLGEGGMGAVYEAEHLLLKKRVALKVLWPERSKRDEVNHRFQQEAIAASRIGHENIVSVTDFGRTPDGAFYLVMELLEGESLAAKIKREGALPAPRAVEVLLQIGRALAAAHAEGIVHRDLKAENVMLARRKDGTECVKVLDFGISKVVAEPETSITRRGEIIGTPDYMSPEQAAADVVDHRADIYSLGILAYELVTGSLPFKSPSAAIALTKHLTEEPEPLRKRRPDLAIPRAVEKTILKAMAKAPADRQQSMLELMADLELSLTAAELPPLKKRGSRPVLGASAAAVLLLGAGIAWVSLRSPRSGASQPPPAPRPPDIVKTAPPPPAPPPMQLVDAGVIEAKAPPPPARPKRKDAPAKVPASGELMQNPY